jgi:hypothetical protein
MREHSGCGCVSAKRALRAAARVGMSLNPRSSVVVFSARRDPLLGDFSGGAGHKFQQENINYLKIVYFEFPATRNDFGTAGI